MYTLAPYSPFCLNRRMNLPRLFIWDFAFQIKSTLLARLSFKTVSWVKFQGFESNKEHVKIVVAQGAVCRMGLGWVSILNSTNNSR